MSAISWLWGSSGLGPGDQIHNPAADPDPVQIAEAAMAAREERLKARDTAAGRAAEQTFMDAREAREAELTSWQVPPGVVLKEFPELARALADGQGGIKVIGVYGPGDGGQAARDLQRIRDAGMAAAIRAGALPSSYVGAYANEVPL